MASIPFLISTICILGMVSMINQAGFVGGYSLGRNHPTFFIFGDSLFDAGNNQYYLKNRDAASNAIVKPYGETTFISPSGRFCDGYIIPDFLAEYADISRMRPYLETGFDDYSNGVNFASAGAGVLPQTAPNKIHMKLQLSYFEKVVQKLKQDVGVADAEKLIYESVYMFSMGGDDYLKVASKHNLTPQYMSRYVQLILKQYTASINEIYALGGRKFLFQNVGPIGCMPATKAAVASSNSWRNGTARDCVNQPQVFAKLHNAALAKLLYKLPKRKPGLKYVLFDFYTLISLRTFNSTKYGFKEGASACCGSGPYNGNLSCGKTNGTNAAYNLCSDPSKYVWFDASNPTQQANKQLSEILWNGHPNYVTGTVGTRSLKTLFQAS